MFDLENAKSRASAWFLSGVFYERAVHDATNGSAKDFASLSKMLAGFFKDLKAASVRKIIDREELSRLLAFLNSLHDQLITQRQRLINKRGGNRYRI